jgi:hypothetical protein
VRSAQDADTTKKISAFCIVGTEDKNKGLKGQKNDQEKDVAFA